MSKQKGSTLAQCIYDAQNAMKFSAHFLEGSEQVFSLSSTVKIADFLSEGKTYYWHPTEHKLSKEPKEGYEEVLINIRDDDYYEQLEKEIEKEYEELED